MAVRRFSWVYVRSTRGGAAEDDGFIGQIMGNKVGTFRAVLEGQADSEAILTGIVGNGTTAGQTLNGTAKDDRLDPGEGNDTLNAGQGNDIVGGGQGNDNIVGGAGFDKLVGGLGNDKLDGSAGPAATPGKLIALSPQDR